MALHAKLDGDVITTGLVCDVCAEPLHNTYGAMVTINHNGTDDPAPIACAREACHAATRAPPNTGLAALSDYLVVVLRRIGLPLADDDHEQVIEPDPPTAGDFVMVLDRLQEMVAKPGLPPDLMVAEVAEARLPR